MTKKGLIVFTRNPVLGKCKTRLAATVGDQAALDIYKLLLIHTVNMCKALPYDVLVYYSEDAKSGDCWDDTRFIKKLQTGADLGAKMQNAFIEGFAMGYEQLVIIGSDLYELTTNDLQNAFDQLSLNDAVFGPAQDGGYYLLGLKKMQEKVFKDKDWGTDTVGAATLNDLTNLQVCLLAQKNDIDYFEDIKDHPKLMALVPKELQV